MNPLQLAALFAVCTAIGHSFLSERLFLQPLRREGDAEGAFSGERAKKLATAMFHLASVCWVGMAVSALVLDPIRTGDRQALHIFAAIFAASGLGNFWAVGKPHPGGIMLLLTAGLTLYALHG